MEYAIEKLQEGMAVAALSEQRQLYLETRCKAYLPQIKEYCQRITTDWPAYPQKTESLLLPEALSEAKQCVILAASYCFLTHAAKNLYLAKGYSEDLWREAMPDINWHTHDYEDGSFWMDTLKGFGWHYSILTAVNITLGRLQFYPRECPLDYPQAGLKKGDVVLGFHIPANGPLDIDACIASFKRAQAFFDKFKPDCQFKAFFCVSWFLNPIYKKYLPPSSNIVRFQNLGISVDFPNDSKDAIRRVFMFGKENVNTPNPRTTLQRILQKIITNGESIASGAIVIPRIQN